ncbi:MAG: hypothetical protein QXN08_04265 [Nitrososphaerales archaeon]
MIFGLALNVGEGLDEAKEISILIARSKIKKIWVSFSSKGRDPFEMASAVAESVEGLKIGIGALSPYIYSVREIIKRLTELTDLYGKRFDLCIGLGDKTLLKELGVKITHTDFLNILKSTCRMLEEELSRLGIKLWLAAQGSTTLSLSTCFDYVLLNHSNLDYLRWALDKIGALKQHISVGISAPAYIYKIIEEDMLNRAKKAALKILLGMSKRLARDLNLEVEYERTLKRLKDIQEGEEAKIVSENLVRALTITMHVGALPNYIHTLRELGITEVVFGYPLSITIDQIKMLNASLEQMP